MLMEKQYIGQCEIPNMTIRYYMIKQGTYYGVELVEEQRGKLICMSELISEVAEVALSLAEKLFKNNVTTVTLTDIIDDWIG